MAEMMNICVAIVGLDAAQRGRLRSSLAAHTLHFCAELPEAEKRGAVAGSEIVFGNVPAAWLEAAAGLRWVQLESAGVDAYLKINVTPRAVPVTLTNLCGFFDHAVAEAVLAGVLAFYRQLPRLSVAQPAARWIKTEVEPAGLRGGCSESSRPSRPTCSSSRAPPGRACCRRRRNWRPRSGRPIC